MSEIELHYCSEELASPELPGKCRVVRWLRVAGFRDKAALIQFARPIAALGGTKFVVLAKGDATISSRRLEGVVGVYLLPHDGRVVGDVLDLSGDLQPVLDWGAVTGSADLARANKVR